MSVEPLQLVASAPTMSVNDRLATGGPLLIKLGHFLASRPDLVADAHIDALAALPDRAAAPLPWDRVRGLLTVAWGSPPEEKLGSIGTEPFAARILDQLHAATLTDGADAIIRIVRPDARALLNQIGAQHRRLHEAIELYYLKQAGSVADVASDFRAWLLGQINLAQELQRRAATEPADGKPEKVEVIANLSTPDVLVTRGVPAQPLLDVAEVTSESAKSIVRLAFKEVFSRCRAHDAPIAANIGIANERADWISSGSHRPLTVIERQDVRRLWAGLHAHDEAAILRAVRRSLEDGERPEWEQAELAILSEVRRHVAARPERQVAAVKRAHRADDVLLGILRAVHEAGLTMAAGPLSAHRMLILAYRTARNAAAIDPEDVGRGCLARLDVREALDTLDSDQISKIVVDLLLLLRDAPERLNQIAADLADGSLGMTLTLDETPKTARAWNRRVRLLATAIVSLGPLFLLGQIGSAQIAGIPIYSGLAVILALLFAYFLLQWRALR